MKSTVFTGKHMQVEATDSHDCVCHIKVSTLSAYAVEYAEFTPPPHTDIGYTLFCQDVDFRVEADSLHFISGLLLRFGELETCRLVVHYHGIRDYELLFPQVTDAELKTTLGRFYSEAELSFNVGAWLSFAVMSAAIYEGLLGWRLGYKGKKFHKLIDESLEKGILTTVEADILHVARNNRNQIHASRREPWLTRAQAMDMKRAMDRLVRALSISTF